MPESATTLDFSAPEWRNDPGPLAAALGAAAEGPVRVDLSELGQPSTLHLQLLLAARRSFQASGRELEFANSPPGFAAAITILGLDAEFGLEAG